MSDHLETEDGKKKKKRKRIMKDFVMDEISVIDSPAQESARVAIMKRAADIAKNLGLDYRNPKLTSPEAGHQHLLDDEGQAGITTWDKSEGQEEGHQHPWVRQQDGSINIGLSEGHDHTVLDDGLNKSATDLLPEEGPLANLLSKGDEELASIESSEDDMTKQNEKPAEEKAVTQEQLDQVSKRAERAEAVVALSGEEREHFNKLQPKGQDEFLTKSADERSAILKNERDADPVVHTDIDGNEYRKSADPVTLRLVKQNDKLRKDASENETLRKRADFVKRAGEELGHLKGDEGAKADLLEAVAGMPVEKQEKALEILKSKDAGMQKALTTIGHAGDGNEDVDPNEAVRGIAKGIRERNPKLTEEQAFVEAMQTDEGKDALAKTRPEFS